MGSDAPTPAREEGLQPYGALYCFGRRSEGGAGGRAESHPACVNGQQLCRKQFPLAGLDAPTPARIGTGRPKGRSHFSFGGERKVCKRKPAARRLREKALYCPFLKEGVRNVARSTVGLPTFTFVRARAHSYPLSKRARLFPSAAYRRSAPPQVALGRLKGKPVGMLRRNLADFAAKKQACFFTTVGTMPTQSASLGMLRRGLDIPVTQKASGILYPRWSLLRAMRPVAEWRPFLFNKQGNHTRPASREARRRAAVKPRPNRISLYAPARPWRAVRGCRGSPPAIR